MRDEEGPTSTIGWPGHDGRKRAVREHNGELRTAAVRVQVDRVTGIGHHKCAGYRRATGSSGQAELERLREATGSVY